MVTRPGLASTGVTAQDGDVIHAFPCGTLPLDFVGTLRARRNDAPTEKLTSAADLDAWFVESGLLPDAPSSGARDLERAVELREAVYALVWARLHDRPLPAGPVATVNAYAAAAPLVPVLTDAGWSRVGDAGQALSQLAREAVEIVGGDQAALLRECGRPECTQVYLDHSRGHRREWCSMATCGSRMKAAAYRARQRADAEA
jgi:predicted RNA-binding Zn ribbon-like protein